jgi:predicted metalloprotease
VSHRFSCLVVLVLAVTPVIGLPLHGAAQDVVDGSTYTSPTYDWSISWGEDWEVVDSHSQDGYDYLELTDQLSYVYFEAYEAFAGNALDCVVDEESDLSDQYGFDDVRIGTDVGGDPLTGGDESNAYSVYTMSFTDADGIETDLVEYNECWTLVDDEAVLEASQMTLRDAYNDAAPVVQDLLRAVSLPGEEVVDPEDATGDGAEDEADDPETLSASEVKEAAEVAAEHVVEFYDEAFDEQGIPYYAPPFMEVIEGESEAPCSEGAIHPGVGSFYCGLNLTIYFDLELEIRDARTGGIASPYYTLGHEAGHDVQMQLGIILSDTLSVEKELEADCMAGSFLAWEVDREAITEDDFFVLLELVNSLGDPEGTSAEHPQAHGMGSQRVAMVLRGYYNGIGACGTF